MICKKSTLLLLSFSALSLFAGSPADDFTLPSASSIELDNQNKEFKELKAEIIKRLDDAIKQTSTDVPAEEHFDWSQVDDFLNLKGKPLGCEKLDSLDPFLRQVIKFIDPVKKFKEAIETDALLKEAMARTILATQEAMEILHEMALRNFQESEEIEKILKNEPFLCAKKGINLILRALCALAKEKKYFDPTNKKACLNKRGEAFIACINGIIKHSMKQNITSYEINESAILMIFDVLKDARLPFSIAIDTAIEKLENFWEDPKNILKLIFEIRALTSDVFHDISSLKGVRVRSAEEVFEACEKRLAERAEKLHRAIEQQTGA